MKKLLVNEYFLVFLFCMAAVHGAAFSLMDNFDLANCPDCKTFLGLAKMDLMQSPIRRYRPIVPALAGGVNWMFGRVFHILKPNSFAGDFALSFSFCLVNSIIVSLWGTVIYRFGKAFGLAAIWAAAGTLVMLTCRWTPYIAGTPMADSIYCLVTGLVLLGIKERNNRLITAAIFLGPFAKEAFIFIAPLIFIYSSLPRGRQLVYFALSGIFVFSFRYLYDRVAGTAPASGLEADLDHLNYLVSNTRRLLSFHGAYDVLSNMGLWLLFPLGLMFTGSGARKEMRSLFPPFVLAYLAVILLHMILSSSFERMFYLTMPVLCMVTGWSLYRIYGMITQTEK